MAVDEHFYTAAERRIEYLTIAIGAVAAIASAIIWGWRVSAGVASVATLARLSTAQVGAEKARVPPSVYLKFLGRYALLIVAAYAILRGFKLPAASLLAGLFAVIAAVLVELFRQLFRSGPEPRELS